LAVNEFQIGRRKTGFRGGQLFAPFGDGGILERAAQPVQFDRQGAGLVIRAQIGRGDQPPAQAGAGIILPLEMFPDFPRQGAFRAVGNQFEGVNEVFALRAQLPQPFIFRHFFQRHFALERIPLLLELCDQGLLGLDFFPQLPARLLEGLELRRRPGIAGSFVVGQHGDALRPGLGKKVRRIALPVKPEGQAHRGSTVRRVDGGGWRVGQ